MYTPDLDLIAAKIIINYDVSNKRVLLRTCLNVSTDENWNMIDDTRLTESLPCISYLAENSKQLVIIAHLWRPKSPSPSTSFAQVVRELEKRLWKPVHFVSDLEQTTIDSIKTWEHQIIMIENIRYFDWEDSKDPAEQQILVDKLTQIADVFLNDAFADYRKSVSSYYIAEHLPSYVGTLFAQEVSKLAYLAHSPKPFVVLMWWSKLSEKLDALLGLLPLADHVLIGGAMAYTLMQAKGLSIWKSLVESDKIDVAQKIMSQYPSKIHLPIDHAVVTTFADPGKTVWYAESISDNEIAVDVWPKTISDYQGIIAQAWTIVRNGPMWVCERTATSVWTNKLWHAIMSNTNAYKVAWGWDSITAINQLWLTWFDHISTGWWAMLAIFGDDGFPTLDVIINQQ